MAHPVETQDTALAQALADEPLLQPLQPILPDAGQSISRSLYGAGPAEYCGSTDTGDEPWYSGTCLP